MPQPLRSAAQDALDRIDKMLVRNVGNTITPELASGMFNAIAQLVLPLAAPPAPTAAAANEPRGEVVAFGTGAGVRLDLPGATASPGVADS